MDLAPLYLEADVLQSIHAGIGFGNVLDLEHEILFWHIRSFWGGPPAKLRRLSKKS
jgi:hypothetical protein